MQASSRFQRLTLWRRVGALACVLHEYLHRHSRHRGAAAPVRRGNTARCAWERRSPWVVGPGSGPGGQNGAHDAERRGRCCRHARVVRVRVTESGGNGPLRVMERDPQRHASCWRW
ncbi:hypothetical protein DFH11DRAFT_1608526 [Phellopilus nigrolimitatus]|nr:hypothetical protein DFH11DRAFT_1608526 [Phellopilus nigrolimitatus]